MKSRTIRIEMVCTAPAQLPPPSKAEVAVVGRSNVGKSSFVNAVLGRKKLLRVSNTPGRTEGVIFVDVSDRGYLVDLPGYGYAKVPLAVKNSWRTLVEAYLKRETRGAAILLIDIRREAGEGDIRIAEWFRYYGRSFYVVMTKADKISRGHWKARADALCHELALNPQQPPIPFSTVTGEGVKTMQRLIEESME